MRFTSGLVILILLGLLTGCAGQPRACLQNSETARPTMDLAYWLEITPAPESAAAPERVSIGGKEVLVDLVVRGPVCNTQWSGTVYVSCDAQVAPWEETPLFFEQCDLEIEPGTVVYVGAHNDTAYYQGCSCHTGEAEALP